MPKRLLEVILACDSTTLQSIRTLNRGENKPSVRVRVLAKKCRLLVMAIMVLFTILSVSNAIAFCYELQAGKVDPSSIVIESDQKPKEVISSDNGIKSDEKATQKKEVEPRPNAAQSEMKLRSSKSFRTTVSEVFESVLLQVNAIPVSWWLVIVPVALFVIYELYTAGVSMMIRPLVCLTIGILLWFLSDILLLELYLR